MSVGLSQVGFDPKVFEDEEEAAFQQDEKEREEEIRNLILNELDDTLLDDGNASFSSHDFRSTSNSRASQQDDFSIQPKGPEWNSNEFSDFPPRRGVFEKPPLMTKRAANFVSHQPSDTDTGNLNPLQNHRYTDFNSNHAPNQDNSQHYDKRRGYNHQSYEFDSFHGNSSDSNGQAYNAKYDGYNEYTGPANPGNQYTNDYQYSHHGNTGDGFQSNDYEYNDGQGYYDDDDDEGNHAPVSPADSSQHDEMSPQEDTHAASFPGNYRVQYVPGYRPQPHVATGYRQDEQQQNSFHSNEQLSPHRQTLGQPSQNTVWRDLRHTPETMDKGLGSHGSEMSKGNAGEGLGEMISDERSAGGTTLAQLQVLYQARGRKIEELNAKYNEREEEMGRQIRVLNHELMILKDEHKGMSETLAQSQQLTQEKQQDIKQIQERLNIAVKEIDALKSERLELQDKLNTANSTIDCLNEQLVQLSRADSLVKARDQHESILNAVRKRQEDEILRLKQKFDDTQLSLNWKTEESNRLRDEVMEKANIINRLNRTLDDSQRQCQELLKTGTVTEISNLRTQLQDTISAKTTLDLNCTSLKNEISGLKEELAMYQNALKYGFADQITDKHSQSLANLGVVRNLNSENWATPKVDGSSVKTSPVDAVASMRKELENSLSLMQTKSQQIREINNELEETRKSLNKEREKVERMDKIVQEQEEKLIKLKDQMQSNSYDQIEKVDSNDDLRQMLEDLSNENKELVNKITEVETNNQQLTEDNLNLKNQMAEMVKEYDEDKRISLEKCRDACLQLHEDAKEQLRRELQDEKEKETNVLRNTLEEVNEELLRVKECYLELSEEKRTIEQRLRREATQELKQDKNETPAIQALKSTLEKRYHDEIEKAREEWKEEKNRELSRLLKEETKKAKEQANEEKAQEIQTAIEDAHTVWKRQLSGEESIEQKISNARLNWIQEQEQDIKKRISDAVNNAKREWKEREKKEVDGKLDKDKSLVQLREHEVAQALSDARTQWLKEEEETRQREIEHAVEVAVTNAVAEAKQQWEAENNVKNEVTYRDLLAKEKQEWREIETKERARAIEASIAIAEVKWIESEQAKISHAVDTAVQAVRSTWAHEKEHDTARAVEDARIQWKANQEQELAQALEEASTQLVERFEVQKREAVEMAVREAKTLWQRNYDQNNNPASVEALRNKLWSEFQVSKQEDLERIIEEETNKLLDKREDERKQDMKKAMDYLESKYAEGLEEFKHKELRNALAGARAEWEKEQELEQEEIFKKRLATAREAWVKKLTLDQSSRSQVDRALATAREAWAAEYEDELDDRVNAEVALAREEMRNEMENGKRREIEVAVNEIKRKFESEEKRLKDEINRYKVMGSPQSLRKKYENELSKLREEHQKDLDRLREEHEDNTRIVRELVEEEFDQKLVAVLHDAKQVWEEEQEEERIQVEDQHQQKLKSVLETAKKQLLKDQEKTVATASEIAVKKQQEVWDMERKSYQSALERAKSELATTKKQSAANLEQIHKDHIEEIKKLRNEVKKRKEFGTQTPPSSDNPSDISSGTFDQLSAAKTMNELREHYLETVAKIRDDVLDHVNQTKSNAAKKIRSEVLKERHSTAKKLRRHYLQCLKQLLEDDKSCTESGKPPLSVEWKIEKMAKALEAVSPEPFSKGNSQSKSNKQQQPDRILPAHKDSYNDNPESTYVLLPKNVLGRPGEYGPEGASDSPKPSPIDKPQQAQNVQVMNSITKKKAGEPMVVAERDSLEGTTRASLHAPSQKPPAIQRILAGSPALSIASVESEQHCDLPSVSPKISSVSNPVTSSGTISSRSTLDDVRSRALARNSDVTKLILRGSKPRGTGGERILSTDRRVDKSRDPSCKSSVNSNRNIRGTEYT